MTAWKQTSFGHLVYWGSYIHVYTPLTLNNPPHSSEGKGGLRGGRRGGGEWGREEENRGVGEEKVEEH